MALANYKLTDLKAAPNEDGSPVVEFFAREGVISRLAPGFDLHDPFDAEEGGKWLDKLLKDELTQRALGVSLEVLDVRALQADAEERLAQKQAELKEAEVEVAEIAAEYLRTITEEEIAEGEIYQKVRGQGPKLVNIVELQAQKTGKSASKVLAEVRGLPDHVKKVLEARAEEDRKATAKRMAGKSSK